MNGTSFLKHYHISLKKRNNMSSSISIKQVEFVVKAFLYRLLQAKIGSVVNVIFEKEITQILYKLLQKMEEKEILSG